MRIGLSLAGRYKMEHGKHKMADGQMMSDKEMEKMEKEEYSKGKTKRMKWKKGKYMMSEGGMLKVK